MSYSQTGDESQSYRQPPDAPPQTVVRRAIRNSVFNAAGAALILPINFVSVFVLARRLGQEGLGIYFTVFAISAIVFLISNSGVTLVITARIARSPQHLPAILGQLVGLWFWISLASVVGFCLSFGVWLWYRGGVTSWWILAAASIALAARQGLEIAAAALRGLERFEFENLSRVIQVVVFLGLILALVTADSEGALWALLAFAISNVLAAAIIAYILFSKWQSARIVWHPRVIRDWWSESLSVGAGDVLRRLSWQLETLLLGLLQPMSLVGLYSIAYRPLQPLQLLPKTIVSVTHPLMSRAAADNPQLVGRTFGQTTALLWVLSIPLSISVGICAKPLIIATAGAEFAAATNPLRLLIWLAGLTFINTQLRFTLTAIRQQHLYWRLMAIVLVGKLVLAWLLIYYFALYGACAGNLLGELLLTVAGLALLRAAGVGQVPWRPFLITLPAGGIMAALLIPLVIYDASLMLMVPCCAFATLIYLFLCQRMGAIRVEHVRLGRSVVAEMLAGLRRRFLAGSPFRRDEQMDVKRESTPADVVNVASEAARDNAR